MTLNYNKVSKHFSTLVDSYYFQWFYQTNFSQCLAGIYEVSFIYLFIKIIIFQLKKILIINYFRFYWNNEILGLSQINFSVKFPSSKFFFGRRNSGLADSSLWSWFRYDCWLWNCRRSRVNNSTGRWIYCN